MIHLFSESVIVLYFVFMAAVKLPLLVHKKLYDKTKRVLISQIPYEHSIWSE